MYLAELKGKLPSDARNSEDILTSNVFSFLKYSKRTVFLRSLMDRLDIKVSDEDLNEAEFFFWPTFEDGTEPDLVIIIGNYYLLFEAKYYSDFGKETVTTEKQLIREVKGGLKKAKIESKDFIFIVITADYYYKPEKFEDIKVYKKCFKWINWQTVAEILLKLIENNSILPNKLFASDLLKLLEMKKLRSFRSFNNLIFSKIDKFKKNIFLIPETTIHRGKFLGFCNVLERDSTIGRPRDNIFYIRKYFDSLLEIETNLRDIIFLKRG